MELHALAPYEDALRVGSGLAFLEPDGRVVPLHIGRYLAPHDTADETVLDRCHGPVLDIGCGPGRLVAGLDARGVPALGVDIAEVAVALTHAGGSAVIRHDIFDPVPAEGQWSTAVLLDGNIGIGGDPDRLLRRVFALLAADGRLLVELDRDDDADERGPVQFLGEDSDLSRVCFLWARLGLTALLTRAARLGLDVVETWQQGDRSFAVVARSR